MFCDERARGHKTSSEPDAGILLSLGGRYHPHRLPQHRCQSTGPRQAHSFLAPTASRGSGLGRLACLPWGDEEYNVQAIQGADTWKYF
jgi:hypothetical protein